MMIKMTRDTYHLTTFLLFIPRPICGQWIAVAYTDQHRFVILVAMLRVLVGKNMGSCYRMNKNAYSN